MQGRIGRIKLLNALSDAIIDLKVALYEAEGTKLKYRPADADRRPVCDGGEGSGNFGHAGRPGKVGGSAPDGAGGGNSSEVAKASPGLSSALVKEHSEWIKKAKLPKMKRQKSQWSAPKRKEAMKTLGSSIESSGIPKTLSKRFQEMHSEAPDSVFAAMINKFPELQVTYQQGMQSSSYNFVNRQITIFDGNVGAMGSQEQKDRIESNQAYTLSHEIAHSIDDGREISKRMSGGEFQSLADKDVGAFVDEATGGLFAYQGGEFYDTKTGDKVLPGSDKHKEMV